MSVGPLGGVFASGAGAQLAQTKGTDAEKAQRDTQAQSRETTSSELADKAAGVGTTDGDQEASDRDADGRRLWEGPLEEEEQESTNASEPQGATGTRQSLDATGESGNQLDLSG